MAQCHARIFLWSHENRIVISDIDGTITKSDILGQILPAMGQDWSQTGVTGLFRKIEHNGYNFIYLSARAISQVCILTKNDERFRESSFCLGLSSVVHNIKNYN